MRKKSREFETHYDDLKNDKSLFVLITITSTEDIYGAYLEVTRQRRTRPADSSTRAAEEIVGAKQNVN